MGFEYTLFILLLPALSFVVLGLAGMKMPHKLAGAIGTLSLAAVFCLSCYTAYEYFFCLPKLASGTYSVLQPYNFTWLPFTSAMSLNVGIQLDPISVMMLIVISTVSFMVHIYSFGYMHGEKGFQRYYAFLSLFTMSMLGLVLATNIFQMYIFWELVGVSSYLLIGFYYPQAAAVSASKKAFIVTRFADLFFLIGILIYGYYTGTFDYLSPEQIKDTPIMAVGLLPTALFLMFIGGAGKSAMFPLHIWLPDAMEGPTPVSALIHAATMVVAGVYQVAKLFPLYIFGAQEQLHWIAYIAAFTAFYAAAVACCQSDIKRVLAFSTISQIGFMFVALGVCTSTVVTEGDEGGLGYMASMFHLFTHAMFKACLFLGAGCIIHAVHSNEKKYMGGLYRYMPVTCITFAISCLAISGIPPFSGFFSKDEILVASFEFSPVMGWIMSGIAMMTAFYMFRLFYCIFFGKSYYEEQLNLGAEAHKPHEAPVVMWMPLVFLALVTCVCGFIPFGQFVSAGDLFDIHMNTRVAVTSVVLSVIAIAVATFMYAGKTTPVADALAKMFPRLHEAAYRRFYMDEVWQYVTHRIIFRLVSTPIAWFDRHVIDGTWNFLAWGSQAGSDSIRSFQSGKVQNYVLWFLVGVVALTLFLLAI
ncbi:MAG: NADH-quinone oxidoreductase subunit L [Prevotella sp.]|nr:NADH-quinone oxidoreductase subunit L [Prevotella sp.]